MDLIQKAINAGIIIKVLMSSPTPQIHGISKIKEDMVKIIEEFYPRCYQYLSLLELDALDTEELILYRTEAQMEFESSKYKYHK